MGPAAALAAPADAGFAAFGVRAVFTVVAAFTAGLAAVCFVPAFVPAFVLAGGAASVPLAAS